MPLRRPSSAKKPAAKRLDPKPTRGAIRETSTQSYRSFYASLVERRDELEAKVTELALKITMQERLISRLLVVLSDTPDEELRRANQEIIRLNKRLKIEEIP